MSLRFRSQKGAPIPGKNDVFSLRFDASEMSLRFEALKSMWESQPHVEKRKERIHIT